MSFFVAYAYGGPLGNNPVILNDTCTEFCLYSNQLINPRPLRDHDNCNQVSSRSVCSGGQVNSNIDPCGVSYGLNYSNTFTYIGYPVYPPTFPYNLYGEAVCKCDWKSSGGGGGVCLPDPDFGITSTDTGNLFCDVTGGVSGVAGDVIWNRGRCEQGNIFNNATDIIIQSQIEDQDEDSGAIAVDECLCDSDYNSANGIDHICNTQRAGFSDCTRTSPLPQVQKGSYYSCDLRYLECSKQNCNGVDYPLSPFNTNKAYGYSACTSLGANSCNLLIDYIVGGTNTIGRRFCNTSISQYAVGTNFYTCNSFNYTFNGCGLDKSVCNKTNLLPVFNNISYTNTESYTNNNDCSRCGSDLNGCISYGYSPTLVGSGTNIRAECSRSNLNMDSSQEACSGCAGRTNWANIGDYEIGEAGCCGDDRDEYYLEDPFDKSNPPTCCKSRSAFYNSSILPHFCDYTPRFICTRPEKNKLDIIFSVDMSDSMEDNDPLGLRLVSTKDFIDKLNSSLDQAGFVPWSINNTKYLGYLRNNMTNLTTDYNFLKGRIDSLFNITWSGTNFDLGLKFSIDELISSRARPDAQKVIIFLTDGEPTNNTNDTVKEGTWTPSGFPGSQIDRAKAFNITIYTIGLNIGSKPNAVGILTEIANDTGGQFFDSANTGFLESAFNAITTRIIKCEETSNPCTIGAPYWTTSSSYIFQGDVYVSNSSTVSLVVPSFGNCLGQQVLFSEIKELGGASVPSQIRSSFSSATANVIFSNNLGFESAIASFKAIWFDALGRDPIYVFDVRAGNQSLNSTNKLSVSLAGGPPIGRYIPDTQVVITREGECKDIGKGDGTGIVNETWRRINTTDNAIIEGPLTYEKSCFLEKPANVPFFSLINALIVLLILSVYYTFYIRKHRKTKRNHKK